MDCELDSLDTTFEQVRNGAGKTVATLRSRRTIRSASQGLYTRKIIEPEIGLKVQLVQRARRLNNRLHDVAFRLLRDLCLDVLKP